jgi:small-conductance mechanosensitive channel
MEWIVKMKKRIFSLMEIVLITSLLVLVGIFSVYWQWSEKMIEQRCIMLTSQNNPDPDRIGLEEIWLWTGEEWVQKKGSKEDSWEQSYWIKGDWYAIGNVKELSHVN